MFFFLYKALHLPCPYAEDYPETFFERYSSHNLLFNLVYCHGQAAQVPKIEGGGLHGEGASMVQLSLRKGPRRMRS